MIDRTKYIPEEEGILYHIISIKWYNKWLKYTFQQEIEKSDNKPITTNDDNESVKKDKDNST